MRIRPYTAADLDDLRRMHAAQGFGYALPNLDSPMFVSKLVLEDDGEDNGEGACDDAGKSGNEDNRKDNGKENGKDNREDNGKDKDNDERENNSKDAAPRVTMAILQRLTAETYLLHDPAAGSPRQRWEHFLALHDAARRQSAACGLDDVQAFLPPSIARAFGRRLERLGWKRDPWTCYTLRL